MNEYPDHVKALSDFRRLPSSAAVAEFLNALLLSAVPLQEFRSIFGARQVPTVYGIIDGEDVTYIGCTTSPRQRLSAHYHGDAGTRRRRVGFDKIGYCLVPAEARHLVEMRMISRVQPADNQKRVQTNTKWGTQKVDDIAATLNIQPGRVWDVCKENGIDSHYLGVDLYKTLQCLFKE